MAMRIRTLFNQTVFFLSILLLLSGCAAHKVDVPALAFGGTEGDVSVLRLYFDGRTLLCWIEDDGAPHDNDGSSDYADYYYEEGCLAYANATTALSTS